MIVNRLKVIEKIHEDSPDLNKAITDIQTRAKENMPKALAREEDTISGVKK